MNTRLILSVILFIVTLSGTVWSAPISTYVAPFVVSGASKPEEMKSTIQMLLLSRLASDKVATVGKADGAEIIVTGSYFLSGSFFSIDASAVNKAGVVLGRAYSQGKGSDELIPAVGSLSIALSAAIEKSVLTTPLLPQVSASQAGVMKYTVATHATGQVVLKMDGALNGLAVGRSLPEGERELFVTGEHVLRYYRQGSGLKLVAEINFKNYETVLSVDTVVSDSDSLPEIYVTIINGEKLESQVWTVEGSKLKKIGGPLPYFFRSITGVGGVKKIYAQQISNKDDFSGNVTEFVKVGKEFKPGVAVKLPEQGYLYNFNFLNGVKGEKISVLLDRSGHLVLFNTTGDELWKSKEEYSGSETSFKRVDLDSTRNEDDGFRRVFLDQRIIIKSDGEMLISKNYSSWYMPKKYHTQNSVYSFAWDGYSLEEKFHTKESGFYLADYAYDESSHDLLLLEVVSRGNGVFDKGSSRLVIRKIE